MSPSGKKTPQNLHEFQALVEVMHRLRQECPWDKEQTHETLIKYALEESHELADAILSKDLPSLVEELGDVLLQVVFHAELGNEKGRFDIHDVIARLNEKLIRRHPHVFAETDVENSSDVLKNWEKIKEQEKTEKGAATEERLGAPVGQPGLMRAQKIGDLTKKEKFDWTDAHQVLAQLTLEVLELKEAVDDGDRAALAHELGDVLFTTAQVARHLKLDAETALKDANNRFEKRYSFMKCEAAKRGLSWNSLSPDEKESLWSEAKSQT